MWWVSKEEQRQALRTTALSQRNSLSKAESLRLSGSIQAKALELPHFYHSSSVALYSPVQNEVGTSAILAHALNNLKRVFYPRIGQANAVELVQVVSVADLTMGRYGILEPVGTNRISQADEESLVVFVPGVVFDPHGHRLGRGQGWYDRMLKQLNQFAVFVALAYEFQVVDDVPTEPWDQKVHYVITEKRVINCGIKFSQPNESQLKSS